MNITSWENDVGSVSVLHFVACGSGVVTLAGSAASLHALTGKSGTLAGARGSAGGAGSWWLASDQLARVRLRG
jgi:hypothetical protein